MERTARKLECFDANSGERISKESQPGLKQLGYYGIDRLLPYGGRFFAVGDSGSVVRLGG